MGLFRKNAEPVETSIEVHSQTIDATGMGDLRQEILVAKQKLLEERWEA